MAYKKNNLRLIYLVSTAYVFKVLYKMFRCPTINLSTMKHNRMSFVKRD